MFWGEFSTLNIRRRNVRDSFALIYTPAVRPLVAVVAALDSSLEAPPVEVYYGRRRRLPSVAERRAGI